MPNTQGAHLAVASEAFMPRGALRRTPVQITVVDHKTIASLAKL